jgi:hypothetical protein
LTKMDLPEELRPVTTQRTFMQSLLGSVRAD